MTVLATIDCGEDTLRAVRLEDGTVALECTRKSGRTERWPIEATDTLRLRDRALTLMSRCGASSAIAHFAQGDIAELVHTVAAAAGCRAQIDPLR